MTYNDWFQIAIVRPCLPISNYSKFMTSCTNINHLCSITCFFRYTVIFTSNNSVTEVSCLKSSCFAQDLIFNFSRIVSVICSNSFTEMYSITEMERSLLWACAIVF